VAHAAPWGDLVRLGLHGRQLLGRRAERPGQITQSVSTADDQPVLPVRPADEHGKMSAQLGHGARRATASHAIALSFLAAPNCSARWSHRYTVLQIRHPLFLGYAAMNMASIRKHHFFMLLQTSFGLRIGM